MHSLEIKLCTRSIFLTFWFTYYKKIPSDPNFEAISDPKKKCLLSPKGCSSKVLSYYVPFYPLTSEDLLDIYIHINFMKLRQSVETLLCIKDRLASDSGKKKISKSFQNIQKYRSTKFGDFLTKTNTSV